MLVENQLEGDEYRVLVYNNKVIAITKRIRPSVIGNGIIQLNIFIILMPKRRRVQCHNINNNLIKQQGYSLNDVPVRIKRYLYRMFLTQQWW